MRIFRIIYRVVVESLIGLKQSGWSNWFVISILATALILFGFIMQVTLTLKTLVNSWGSQLEISVYLKDSCKPYPEAQKIGAMKGVEQVLVIPKEEAWQKMRKSFSVAYVDNPLPNTLHIKLKSPTYVEQLAPIIKAMQEVENVRYPLKVARIINQIRRFVEIGGLFVMLAMSAATLIVIGNTIQLVIQSKQREIEILSLMGVSHFYIKGPFILQGILYGTSSALIASGLIAIVNLNCEKYVKLQLAYLAPSLTNNLEFGLTPIYLMLFGLGIAVGATGGAITSGRFIKL